MLVVYDSRTGNVQRFINKLNLKAVRIEEDLTIQEPFVLVTYTTGFGQIPGKVLDFLKHHSSLLRGVAASGNQNWGQSFALSADRISSAYGVPVLAKFELSGTSSDVERFHKGVRHLEAY
ncbi:class Ib ribonucleoside-diphosphate reductase assembly flavoprotein NrdI [Paenibacillus chitinolyticus]|uniref:Protein NrdI n=1 Tax=Paenibacillus chitinolyticus TaxID=79263 RepID=A0A410X3R9_9BACL|nr:MULTISPECIES: class Ib ribonucleoside-diphosphate reductase assembly flavoprotein NrdI [Paenibacillus]EGL15284.1 nrdI protein [Paenibacillus sp. HGF7]EPD88835.1 nrdI protein [Paenibacillus sp. HGH0039]MBV6717069.1 class Ib ribonucleoside-diphosphate reductase assembly flavoprotein NrdI [Paenibacillus chitinolyticus]MCY9593458.1 class Ib ribonucleoside-diphosphate reductase assembly flavoprotein NrdI [Paenibacillus chitinolyticus]MCY9596205.1 class Ib ribonucleoside-diphosphate reductase ass